MGSQPNTWTAIDADTKLCVTYYAGDRGRYSASAMEAGISNQVWTLKELIGLLVERAHGGHFRMKPWWFGRRNYTDEQKLKKKREALAKIREILEFTADEQDFVKLVKEVDPDISGEELANLIALFHQSVREKRGLG
jgi:hypothetical protein